MSRSAVYSDDTETCERKHLYPNGVTVDLLDVGVSNNSGRGSTKLASPTKRRFCARGMRYGRWILVGVALLVGVLLWRMFWSGRTTRSIRLLERNGKVPVRVYMESFCPDTTTFLNEQLWPAWQQVELREIMDLEIIPFGKADWVERGGDYSFECQHGAKECLVNQLMCCGIHNLSTPEHYMPYIHCLQNRLLVNTPPCSQVAGVNHASMLECTNGRLGRRLHYEAGVKTKALRPRLHFVPWVMIGGTRDTKALRNFSKRLCDAYSGEDKPLTCQETDS